MHGLNKHIRNAFISMTAGMFLAFILASSFLLLRNTRYYPQIHLSISRFFDSDNVQPSPYYSFEMVVDIQMRALIRHEPQTWSNFVHKPNGKAPILPFHHQQDANIATQYSYVDYSFGRRFVHAGYVMQTVEAHTSGGQKVELLFVLKYNEESPYRHCWLTYQVYQISVEQEGVFV